MRHFFRFLLSKTLWINVIIILILLSGGIYVMLQYLNDYTNHGEVVVVPSLGGMMIDEAENSIESGTNLVLEITDSIYKKGTKAGAIIAQNPKPASKVKEGRKIYLTVAANHPPQITMPRLIDRSYRQATSLMETYGLNVGKLIYKADFCLNCILDQQIDGKTIEEGTRIERGSTIDLVVGQGLSNELTPVPYLLGMNSEAAELLLESRSLNIGATIYDDDVLTAEDSAKAIIYNQSPVYSAAPVVRMGTSVDLFLSTDTNKVPANVIPVDSL